MSSRKFKKVELKELGNCLAEERVRDLDVSNLELWVD